MAKKDKSEAAEAEGSSKNRTEAPAGFRSRVSATDAPWFTQKEGNICFGKLLGRYVIQAEPPRPYYQVELYQDTTVTVGRGDEVEETVAKAGDIVNVGETFKLLGLKDVEIPALIAGGEYDVWIEYEKKIKVGQGHTMWVIDMKTKQMKAPTMAVRALPKDEGEVASEGAPF